LEEYLNSEKYELRERALDGPLLPMLAALNTIRRGHPALQRLDNVSFLQTENDALIAYAKTAPGDTLIVVVNLDPGAAAEGVVIVPPRLVLAPEFGVVDLLSGERFDWRLGRNFVRLDPAQRPAHVLAVTAPQ
jgi:starch synthase (maltosyl-transferring)